ncbi:MAG: hypothetical protein CLLPBCKN_001493 [Chroococcidiopsis cubana SAG 39.79]|uniref:Uncharacterized protein n=1 Tax=Chroococcidiopsis cubana SAG 39.79 TaxID=388085 RepID=A0AB37UB60_9CYAN|nr:hypothetical protein [Chroococcidiopsis cubana]MDZ4872105.1 hypothetical protein [Chroococcidiopsis cubana SAG 39.79]PSB60669.1 hypothetical protein C7B79_24880 [Chroococcidiopsis cubana CCALA 043]RUT02918.1 hypothetical protein DSM107010_61850 [Chroococcidiopsis cubana SAG 39.79]
MSNILPIEPANPSSVEEVLAKTVVEGDLSKLSPKERVMYYNAVCNSLGLNPLTKPFELIRLNGKLTLYARKDCTDQLRKLHHISIDSPQTQVLDGQVFVVTVTARTPDGRTDTDVGVVSIKGVTGEALCNLIKSKRRVTLSICGMGFLDETETPTIPDAVTQSTFFDQEVWRSWKTPMDAIEWAHEQLPHLSETELWQEFNNLSAVNGKKIPAWVEKVNSLMLESR